MCLESIKVALSYESIFHYRLVYDRTNKPGHVGLTALVNIITEISAAPTGFGVPTLLNFTVPTLLNQCFVLAKPKVTFAL